MSLGKYIYLIFVIILGASIGTYAGIWGNGEENKVGFAWFMGISLGLTILTSELYDRWRRKNTTRRAFETELFLIVLGSALISAVISSTTSFLSRRPDLYREGVTFLLLGAAWFYRTMWPLFKSYGISKDQEE